MRKFVNFINFPQFTCCEKKKPLIKNLIIVCVHKNKFPRQKKECVQKSYLPEKRSAEV